MHEHFSLVGRLHPLLVHFPIGLVLAAAGSELVATWTRRPSWRAVAAANLGAGALASGVALIAGWMLASTVEVTTSLTWHRWTAVAATIAAVAAAVMSRSRQIGSRRSLLAYRSALFGAAALMALAGHLGGVLVWGANFLKP